MQNSVRINSPAKCFKDPPPLARPQSSRSRDVPGEIDSRRNLVRMLTAWTGGSRERELDLRRRDFERAVDANPFAHSCFLRSSGAVTGSSHVPLWHTYAVVDPLINPRPSSNGITPVSSEPGEVVNRTLFGR